MRSACLVVHVLLLLFATSRGVYVFSSTTSAPIGSLHYYAIYDPLSNSGLLEITASISSEDPIYVEIPLGIFGESAEFTLINYTCSGNLYIAGVNMSDMVVVVLLYGSGELRVALFAKNLVEESGIAAYLLTVNTEDLRNTTLSASVTLIFTGIYRVEGETVKLAWSTKSIDNTTQITLEGFGLGVLILLPSVEEVTETSTLGQPGQPLPWSTIIVGASSIIAVMGFGVYFLKKRRKGEFTVERVDYLADSSYRAIIKLLGDSGNKGLLQSEIVSKTGLSKSTVSRRLKRLEEEEFIVIKRSGKYNYVYLTDKGLEAYKKITRKGAH